jgi:hypothetical protein
MSDKKRIDVFISSTSYDLPEHRKAVIDALASLNLQPIGMEYWAVKGEDPVILCERNVRQSEAFIGIYAYRYGWCPVNKGGKSITEMEYDWAETVICDGKPIPRFCFIMEVTHPITIGMVETEKNAELEAFKKRVKEGHHVGFFRSADDLKAQVIHALASWSTEKRATAKKMPPSTVDEITKQEHAKVIAYRITRGADLTNILAGSHAHHMGNDDLQNNIEAELVGNFLQNLSDYGDLWDDFGPYERTKTQLELQHEIDELDVNGFLVYGCCRKEKHRFGLGSNSHVVDLQVLYIFALRKSNPRVKRNHKIESAMGFNSQAFSGEFAPFLIYIRMPE